MPYSEKEQKTWIDVKLVYNEKDYLKCASKPRYMPHKMFDNNLVEIRKSKVSVMLNKPTIVNIKMQKVWMELFQQKFLTNVKMYCWIKNAWDI